MKKFILLSMFALAGCTAGTNLASTENVSDVDAFARANQAVLMELKDPESAKFGKHFRLKKVNSYGVMTDTVCGTVNAKNSYGGFTGMTAWFYRIGDGKVYFDKPDNFALATTWCVS